VAVVCGAGINCLGLGPDGQEARFPALGDITGDWGGGQDIGLAAVWAAARSEDGRGPKTSLETLVPAHFGVAAPLDLAQAVHAGAIARRRFIELAPIVLAASADDDVAAQIVRRLADEVVALVRVALERIAPVPEPPDVVLGGGVLQARNELLLGAIDAGLERVDVPHSLVVVDAPPVVGAALRALDALGADSSAQERLRSDERLAEVTNG
jgi:N-acetylglucosamine kinase-like BadF-type ATPase